MNISDVMVRATAARFSAVELRKKIAEAQDKLATGSVITQASGPGSSYTRTLVMTPEQAIELYQLALEYKTGQAVNPIRTESFCDPGTAC